MKARVLGLIGGGVLLSLAAPADADQTSTTAAATAQTGASTSAAVLTVGADGNLGRLDGEMRRRGPGFEQSMARVIKKDGKQYILVTYMESVNKETDPNGVGPYTVGCSSYEMSATSEPKPIAQRVRIYGDRTRRGGNHPRMAIDDNGNALVGIGSDMNRDRPSAYVMYIDHACRVLAPAIKFSYVDSDSNDGATEIVPVPGKGPNGETRFMAAYLSTNGGPAPLPEVHNDNVWVSSITVKPNGPGLYTLSQEWPSVDGAAQTTLDKDGDSTTPETVSYPTKTSPMAMIINTDIGRPTMEMIDQNRALLCAAQGAERPPMDGIRCVVFDTMSGSVKSSAIIAPADRDNHRYPNQPTIARLDATHFVLHTNDTSAMGKNSNIKGQNKSVTRILELQGDTLLEKAKIENAPVHQTHSSICTTNQGTDGKPTIAVFSAAPTGIGRAALRYLHWDGSKLAFDDTTDTWPVSWYGDSGHLSNWYGDNPMNQGRDFLRCEGRVPNLGYHVEGGFMKDVKSFVVAPVAGRIPGNAKNSLFMGLVPAEMDTVVTPENPKPAEEVQTTNAPPAPPAAPAASDDSKGCACSTPGHTSSSDFGGGLLLLGLAMGGIVSRRRS